MQGEGTADNPYITPEWEDFRAAMEESGVYILIPAGTVWDFSRLMPDGADFGFSGTGNRVYGCGSAFRNLRIKNSTLIDYGLHAVFYDTDFTDMTAEGGTFTAGGYFYHCRFTGRFTGSSVFMRDNPRLLDNEMFFRVSGGKGCSFNLGFYDSASFCRGAYYPVFESPNLRLFGQSSGDNFPVRINDGFIHGTLPFSSASFAANRCIFDIEAAGSIACTGSMSIINADRVTGTHTGFTAVNSKQLRSTEYLAAVGFPIGGDSEEVR